MSSDSSLPPTDEPSDDCGIPARFLLARKLTDRGATDAEIYAYLKSRADRRLDLSIRRTKVALHIGWKRAKETLETFRGAYFNKRSLQKLLLTSGSPSIEPSSVPTQSSTSELSNLSSKARSELANRSLEGVPDLKPEVIYDLNPEVEAVVQKSAWIECDNLTVKLAQRYHVKIPDLGDYCAPKVEIPEGAKVILILGASGAGKTTLLRRFGDVDVPVKWHPGRAVV
eukprot:332449_1